MKWLVLLGIVLSVSAFGTYAVAENDIITAREMYERGERAREKSLWDIACPSFAESYRLYPIAGTMFELADCEQHAGKTASAFNHYHQYLIDVELLSREKAAIHAERVKKAEEAIPKLREEIPRLSIVVPSHAPSDIIVMRDAVTLAPASFGVALPVDPDKHVVKVLSSDKQVLFHREVKIEPKKTETVEVELVKIPTPVPTTSATPPPPPPIVQASGPARISVLQAGGFLGLGVGLAGLTTTAVFGGLAMANLAEAKPGCIDTSCKAAQEGGNTLATFATASFGVGVAGLAAGTVLLVVDQVKHDKKDTQKKQPIVGVDMGPTGTALTVRGVF